MRIVLIIALLFYFFLSLDVFYCLSIGITAYFLITIFLKADVIFAFREWTLFLYAVNYLLAPTITYQFDQALLPYPMKIDATEYFQVALVGFFSLYLGMYVFKTRIFKPDFKKVKRDASKNETLLKNFVFFGLILFFIGSFLPGELKFLFYLLSSIRYIGAFTLYSLNSRKYSKWLFAVLAVEFYFAFINAMFHDAIMWLLFFALYFVYTEKPSLILRIYGISTLILLVLFIQGLKSNYRSKTYSGAKSDLTLVVQSSNEISDEIGSESNLLSTLNRANQAWILASTIDRMDQIKDFQGLNVLNIYLEAALLPRFLAPNKIISGDKKIFNTFSGHTINSGTSMGLGVFADGYIAFGYWGVVLFTFGLGLLFNLTFIVIESWSKLSEFYVLMVLPVLNYAVRPDCELQTIINHTVKGLFVFGVLVFLTKYNFVVRTGLQRATKINRISLPEFKSLQN